MNTLTRHIKTSKLDEFQIMNQLTEAGIISDNCVRSEDVAHKDCETACNWLKDLQTPKP